MDATVYTITGECFSQQDHEVLAGLMLIRFGYDHDAAAAAWRSMLGNDCTVTEFQQLATPGCNIVRSYRKEWNNA